MKGVAVHWTVTLARSDHAQCEADWAGVIAMHDRQGYRPSPAYNYGACQHGIRMEGRTWAIRSAANGTTEANLDYWAIVALNAPGDTPSPELLTQLATLIDEAPDLESRLVRPHSDFFATACCGDELRAWIAAGAQSPGGPPPGLPTSEDEEMPALLVRAPSSNILLTQHTVVGCSAGEADIYQTRPDVITKRCDTDAEAEAIVWTNRVVAIKG